MTGPITFPAHQLHCPACEQGLRFPALALKAVQRPTGFWLRPGQTINHELAEHAAMKGISALRDIGARLVNRRAKTFCLACGSNSTSRIAISGTNVVAGIRHDACGGVLRAVGQRSWAPDDWRLYGRKTLFFDWAGTFKWALASFADDSTPIGEPTRYYLAQVDVERRA